MGDWPWCADELGSRSRQNRKQGPEPEPEAAPAKPDDPRHQLGTFIFFQVHCQTATYGACLFVCPSACLQLFSIFLSNRPNPSAFLRPPFFLFLSTFFFCPDVPTGLPIIYYYVGVYMNRWSCVGLMSELGARGMISRWDSQKCRFPLTVLGVGC